MTRFRLVLEYDGTEFQGWQAQGPGARTVQQVLEAAAAELAGAPVALTGAGRTDAGVHAEGQVASLRFDTPPADRLDAAALVRALNTRLPDDVAVLSAERVPDAFDPRRDARSKLYRYDIWNGPRRSPLHRRRWHRVAGRLDLAAMARAARDFEGEHDFAALQSTGSSVKTSRRTVLRSEVESKGPEIHLFVEGNGFLRHMVRTMAGTLLEVALGRRAEDSIPALLAGADRAAAGPTAPACGLTLLRIHYPDSPGEAPAPGGQARGFPS